MPYSVLCFNRLFWYTCFGQCGEMSNWKIRGWFQICFLWTPVLGRRSTLPQYVLDGWLNCQLGMGYLWLFTTSKLLKSSLIPVCFLFAQKIAMVCVVSRKGILKECHKAWNQVAAVAICWWVFFVQRSWARQCWRPNKFEEESRLWLQSKPLVYRVYWVSNGWWVFSYIPVQWWLIFLEPRILNQSIG